MTNKSISMIMLAIGMAITAQAQVSPTTIKEDFKPSSVNQPGQDYPQVNSQGYARFRVKAPQADSVKVSLGLGGRGGR
ncbi:hypothetical protein [Pedobacter ginsengisoli]|uniref:hypothetical protein n=1 Tax=Pedobacter ginsengisoli TaxID=363852 RepID=UPI00254D7BF8|nr:hypothetical protein [Pedobacter ginsengisoli]